MENKNISYIVVLFSILTVIIITSVSAVDINSCKLLNSANTVYDMTTDIIANETFGNFYCLRITANNVTLDCHGLQVYNTTYIGSAIYASSTFANIKNCVFNITSAGSGVMQAEATSSNLTMINNTFWTGPTKYHLRFFGGNYVNIVNNTFNQGVYGIYWTDTAHDYNFTGNKFLGNSYAMYTPNISHTMTNFSLKNNLFNHTKSIWYNEVKNLMMKDNLVVINGTDSIFRFVGANNVLFNLTNMSYSETISNVESKFFIFHITNATDLRFYGITTGYPKNINAVPLSISGGNNIEIYNNNISKIGNYSTFNVRNDYGNLTNVWIHDNYVFYNNSQGTYDHLLDCGPEGYTGAFPVANCTIENNLLVQKNLGGSTHGIFVGHSNNSRVTNNIVIGFGMGYVFKGNTNLIATNDTSINNSISSFYTKSGFNDVMSNLMLTQENNETYGILVAWNRDTNWSSTNITYKDINMNIPSAKSPNTYPVSVSTNSQAYFINASYNTSKEYVAGPLGENMSLIRKWYYSANVTDSSYNPLSSVLINALDKVGNLAFNIYTDASGISTTYEVTDYINNGDTINYSSNYNFTYSLAGYTSYSELLNFTQLNNQLFRPITLNSTIISIVEGTSLQSVVLRLLIGFIALLVCMGSIAMLYYRLKVMGAKVTIQEIVVYFVVMLVAVILANVLINYVVGVS